MANNILQSDREKETRRKLMFISALLSTIADAGTEGAPSGICYMAMQMHGVDIASYTSMLEGLKTAGLITCKAHVLRVTPKALALMK